MKIDGFKISTEKRDQSIIRRVSPEGAGSYKHLRLVIDEKRVGLLELLEGDTKPGIDDSEVVTFVKADDQLIERLIRAMAYIHFDSYNQDTDSLDVDKSLIQRGFDIGVNSSGNPVWISNRANSVIIISSTPDGGLPVHEASNAYMIYRTEHGHQVRFTETTVRNLIGAIDDGLLQKLGGYNADLEVVGLLLEEPTFH